MEQKNKHNELHFSLENKKLKENPFQVPGGYFDELTNNILNKAQEENSPKKIKLRKVFSYAAAACIVIVFGLFYLNKPKSNDLTVDNIFEYLQYEYIFDDDNTLLYTEYADILSDETSWDFSSLSDTEIENYFDEYDFDETIIDEL